MCNLSLLTSLSLQPLTSTPLPFLPHQEESDGEVYLSDGTPVSCWVTNHRLDCFEPWLLVNHWRTFSMVNLTLTDQTPDLKTISKKVCNRTWNVFNGDSWPHTPDSWRWYHHCNQPFSVSQHSSTQPVTWSGASREANTNLTSIFFWPWYNYDTICHEAPWLIAPTVFSYLLQILTSQQLQRSWLMRFIFQDNESWSSLGWCLQLTAPGRK